MLRKCFMAAMVLTAVALSAGIHRLTAQEIPVNGARISPKQLKALREARPVLTAASVHSVSRSIRDLRAIANDLDAAGQRTESARLTTAINEMVRRAEQQLSEKRAQIAKLNEEVEELMRVVGE